MGGQPMSTELPDDLFVGGLLAGLSFGRGVPDDEMRRAVDFIVRGRDALALVADLAEAAPILYTMWGPICGACKGYEAMAQIPANDPPKIQHKPACVWCRAVDLIEGA